MGIATRRWDRLSGARLAILLSSLALVSGRGNAQAEGSTTSPPFPYFKAGDTVAMVVDSPAFADFRQFLFPAGDGPRARRLLLDDVGSLLPYHGHIDPKTTISSLNAIIDEVNAGRRVFHKIYTLEQQKADPAKTETGLFFFPGRPGQPFALICPGGGFSYVGSIHEGFPHAIALRALGYNAFVLHYRLGGERIATEDLAAALEYIFAHGRELGIGTRAYSLWGSSAGARMVANIGSYGTAAYGARQLPPPACVVMAYTGRSAFTEHDPPTFAVVSRDDPIADARVVKRRIQQLQAGGVSAELLEFDRVGHGFGLGVGTEARGWIDSAIAFWERHR